MPATESAGMNLPSPRGARAVSLAALLFFLVLPCHAAAGRDRVLSLRAVMRFVTEQSRDADAGQLDIYRAFVRVERANSLGERPVRRVNAVLNALAD